MGALQTGAAGPCGCVASVARKGAFARGWGVAELVNDLGAPEDLGGCIGGQVLEL